MIIIGLTGSIGMGKTTTARFFEAQGIPVFDADAEVRDAQKKDGEAIAAIAEAFPGAVIDGVLDRQKLGAQVFSDAAALSRLENILHPIVNRRRLAFFQKAEAEDVTAVMLDVPLLFETGIDTLCDIVVVVSASADVQKKRVLARVGMTEEKLEGILNHQLPDKEKRKKADFVIETDMGLDDAKQQALIVLGALKNVEAKAYKEHWIKNA